MIEYVVARRWPSGEICSYTEYSREVFSSDTIKQALAHAKYISEKENKEYKVFLLKEYKED